MTEQQYIIAKDLYLQGKSLRQIGEKLNINRKKLSARLKEDGITTSRFISDEQVDKAIELLDEGKDFYYISERLKCDRQVISKAVRARGHKWNGMRNNAKSKYDYNSSTALSIVDDYNNMSISSLSNLYGVSTNTIQNILAYHNVDTNKNFTSSYECDETFFKNIDTEAKAYWLGFLYADGSVMCGERYVLELGLKHSDKEHIVKFLDSLKCNNPITDREVRLNGSTFKSSRVQIYNKNLVNDLVAIGCTPRKSLILEFPNIQSDLVHHFMRGYFDGDGSIVISKGQLRFSVLGTEKFLNDYVDKLGLHKNKFNANGNAYSTGYSGNKLVRGIYEFLYKDSTIYLDRKRSKFTAVLG